MFEDSPSETLTKPQKTKKPSTIGKNGKDIIKLLSLKPFWKQKKVIFSLGALFILIVLMIIQPFKSAKSDIPTYKVKRDKFLVSITESGELRAKNSVAIVAPRVRSNPKIIFMIPEGTFVKAGDEVVKFDPTEAYNNLKDAEGKLEIALSDKEKQAAGHRSQTAQMDADLQSAELTLQLSKLSLDQMKFEAEVKQRQAGLDHQKNVISFERTKKDIESKKIIQQSEKSNTEIIIRQRQTDLTRAKNDLDQLTLKSTAEGLVVYERNWSNNGRKVAIGDMVWPGMTIVTLPDLSTMESMTFVNEVDVSQIKKGLKVRVKLDAFPDSVFDGTIADIASLGKNKDNNPNIKVFEIAVTISGKSSILKPGMTTSNRFIIKEIPNVLSIPQEAIFEKDGKKIVYVKHGSGFDAVPVEVGEKNENHIVIKKGIDEGADIALRDPTIKLDETDPSKEDSKPNVQMPKAGK